MRHIIRVCDEFTEAQLLETLTQSLNCKIADIRLDYLGIIINSKTGRIVTIPHCCIGIYDGKITGSKLCIYSVKHNRLEKIITRLHGEFHIERYNEVSLELTKVPSDLNYDMKLFTVYKGV